MRLSYYVPEITAGAVLAAIVALGAYVFVNTTKTGERCIAQGYPQAYTTWSLERYCIRRDNYSDVVVRLDSLEGR